MTTHSAPALATDSQIENSEPAPSIRRGTPRGEWPWWKVERNQAAIFFWIVLIHLTAAVGLVLFPIPSWRVLAGAIALTIAGGMGTTVCYHRALAHRSVRLSPLARRALIFFAIFNGSGNPLSWVANHRLHHAYADTTEDISSPVFYGFWWAHLRWLWQAEQPSVQRFCREMDKPEYHVWRNLQPVILAVSYLGGLYFGWMAFFWLGAIRITFSLHAQCFVNSVCHTEPGIVPGEDSSRNVRWLGVMQLFVGENWHRNHHMRPGLARRGWNWRQPDAGYVLIRALEKIGMATEVRDFRRT